MPIAWLQKLLGNNQGRVRLVTEVSANPIIHQSSAAELFMSVIRFGFVHDGLMVLERSLAEFRVV